MMGESIGIDLLIDTNNQWFVELHLTVQKRNQRVWFKLDTGCNSVVLSHKTLKKMGYSTKDKDFAKLTDTTATLASGEKSTFKKIGTVSLAVAGKQQKQICDANAICHASRETNDLLGTEVLRQFSAVIFNLDDKLLELVKKSPPK